MRIRIEVYREEMVCSNPRTKRVNAWWTYSHRAMLRVIVWDTFSAIPHIRWVHFSIPDFTKHPVAQVCALTAPALAAPPVSHSPS